MTIVLLIVVLAVAVPLSFYWYFMGGRRRQLDRQHTYFQRRAQSKKQSTDGS
jgi:hypothetical protein